MDTFAEISYPELVADVQSIYWNTIHPIGQKTLGYHIKSIVIDRHNPEHLPLINIFLKYQSILSPHFLMIHLTPSYTTPIHMDGAVTGKKRPTSFNIPIQGCNGECVTEFYDIPEESFWTDIVGATRWLKEDHTGPKIGEYRLMSNPILVCPQTPHRVNNLDGTQDRLTVSWSLRTDWSFQQALNFFKEQNRVILN